MPVNIICSWKQPVQSKWVKLLAQGNNGIPLMGFQTHNLQLSTVKFNSQIEFLFVLLHDLSHFNFYFMKIS